MELRLVTQRLALVGSTESDPGRGSHRCPLSMSNLCKRIMYNISRSLILDELTMSQSSMLKDRLSMRQGAFGVDQVGLAS
jgi:hypothetical protein